MNLDELARTSAAVAATRRRTEKIELLAECLTRLAPDEYELGASWLAGELPQGRIGVGWAGVRAALANTHSGPDGGLGTRTPSLREVNAAFDSIQAIHGKGAQRARAEQLHTLFEGLGAQARHFLAELLLGELRQGALEAVLIAGVAKASGVPLKAVQRAVMLSGSPGQVANAVLQGGEAGLAGFQLTVLTPVQPMLAHPAIDIEDALEQHLEKARGAAADIALEYKMDGARIQLHKHEDDVRIFTRALNDVTARLPEVVERARALAPKSLILDGEVLCLTDSGTPHPFQTTMRRFGRSKNIDELLSTLPVSAFYFDCLLVDDRHLMDEPADVRYAVMDEIIPAELRMPFARVREPDAAAAFLRRALSAGHEGVMAKALSTPYEAGSRGAGWLKVKPAHTLDLVVLAAEWGSGRRKGWLSNLHLGAYDPDRESHNKSGNGAGSDKAPGHQAPFVMVGKTFKGLTDEMLAWQTEYLLTLERSREDNIVWVDPKLVVEVALNEVQKSPRYPAGLAMRFMRVKRYREDKRPQEADTIDVVRRIHDAQSK